MRQWMEAPPIIIEEARDCFIRDIYGRWYLDGVSSMWVNVHGHGHRHINERLKTQIDRLAHSTLLGLSNVPAIELAHRVVTLLGDTLKIGPDSLNKVFFSDNGSTAVEVALKMAFGYWRHIGVTTRDSFICLNNAYHGDTLGAVSVGGIDVFHALYAPLLFKTHRSPSPYCYRCELGLRQDDCDMRCLKEMEAILSARRQEIAAVIIEPMIQAAGGMIVAPKGFLSGVSELCHRYDTLLIADEVATGFGRTGEMFACQHEGVVPDIICLSKGITGGYMPLALTVASQRIFDAYTGEYSELKAFFHGHSYTGNPLGCACALACLDVFEAEGTIEGLRPKVELLARWLRDIAGKRFASVGQARGVGLMVGVELVADDSGCQYGQRIGWQVAEKAKQKGVLIRPLGNVVVIMPPLAISMDNLATMLSIIEEAIAEVTDAT
ncbi:MAG: adenosylmethionine--8-amino-7-oxononanoate transaminase [Nitrospirae bacterium]|nr:adenosylmethionine--8-amino-7-oxononanoate transaminase [Nitrospirota bacterium]MBF0591848.1 adenosylmethionine--8-amino-7-oxononanoate transaminase [Nitrospirota bacterium]